MIGFITYWSPKSNCNTLWLYGEAGYQKYMVGLQIT